MSVSSVSGVGQGSADKKGHRGSEHLFVGVEKLVGTRIVHSGSVTLSSGTATVTFPTTLPGSASDYIVISGGSAAYSYASSVATTGFTMNGTGSQVVSYIVAKISGATVEVN